MDDAGSQSPERVHTNADDPGNDHLSENAGQNTARGFGSTEEEIQEVNASKIASAGPSRPISL